MDPITILAMVNTLMSVVANLIDHAREAGATPAQIGALRAAALDRFNKAEQAVEEAQPPA